MQRDLGPVAVLFWNPISTPAPLLTATPEQLQSAYNVTVTGVRGAWGTVVAAEAAALPPSLVVTSADRESRQAAVQVPFGGRGMQTYTAVTRAPAPPL